MTALAGLPCFEGTLIDELLMIKNDGIDVVCGRLETYDDVQLAIAAMPSSASYGLLVDICHRHEPKLCIDSHRTHYAGMQVRACTCGLRWGYVCSDLMSS